MNATLVSTESGGRLNQSDEWDPAVISNIRAVLAECQSAEESGDFERARRALHRILDLSKSQRENEDLAAFCSVIHSYGMARSYALEAGGDLTTAPIDLALEVHRQLRFVQDSLDSFPERLQQMSVVQGELVHELLEQVWVPVSRKAEELLDQAFEIVDSDVPKAIELAKRVVSFDLRDELEGNARMLLGNALREQGKLGPARTELQKAVALIDTPLQRRNAQKLLRAVQKGNTTRIRKHGCFSVIAVLICVGVGALILSEVLKGTDKDPGQRTARTRKTRDGSPGSEAKQAEAPGSSASRPTAAVDEPDHTRAHEAVEQSAPKQDEPVSEFTDVTPVHEIPLSGTVWLPESTGTRWVPLAELDLGDSEIGEAGKAQIRGRTYPDAFWFGQLVLRVDGRFAKLRFALGVVDDAKERGGKRTWVMDGEGRTLWEGQSLPGSDLVRVELPIPDTRTIKIHNVDYNGQTAEYQRILGLECLPRENADSRVEASEVLRLRRLAKPGHLCLRKQGHARNTYLQPFRSNS